MAIGYSKRGKMYARRKLKKRGGMRKKQFGGGGKIKQPVQYFKRTRYEPGFYSLLAGGAAVGASKVFTLNDVPQSGEFTALYDQFQIKAIKIQLIPRFTEVPNSSTQGNMWSVLDQDDATPPPNIDTVLQYQNVKRTQMNKIHTRYFKPRVAREVFSSGITSTYSPAKNTWIDVAAPGTEHYAIKFWFDSRATNVIYDVQTTYYLAFKNVR